MTGPTHHKTNSSEATHTSADANLDEFFQMMDPNLDDFDFGPDLGEPLTGCTGPTSEFTTDNSLSVTPNTESARGLSTAATSPTSQGPTPANSSSGSGSKTESHSCCEVCGYRPEGDPRWFPGSMAKHKKLQHGPAPPVIYQCPYPGCTSKYTNRPDNLRQHQIKKGHFVDGEEEEHRRPNKRKKMAS